MNDFHESYYDHACSILPDKDVLVIEIPGPGVSARFRRWWHNLFLVNYADERSRLYYNSSHAIAMERMRQFRWFRNRIHPLSKFRNFWDLIMLLVFIIYAPLFTITSSFLRVHIPVYWYYIGFFLELITIVDLFISFKTSYINRDNRTVVFNSTESKIQFCSTKLLLHVASAIPTHWIMFLRYGSNINCSLCKTNYFICVLKVINVFTLYRMYESSAYMIRKPRPAQFSKFFRIAVVAAVTTYHYINLSLAYNVFYILNTNEVHPKSSMSRLIILTFANESSKKNVNEISNFFLQAVIIITFDLKYHSFFLDNITSICWLVMSIVFTAWILVECFSYVSRKYYSQQENYSIQNKILNLVENQQLPDKIRSKVNYIFDFQLTKYKTIEKEHGLYSCLPNILKNEVILTCYYKCLMRLPFFKEWPLDLIEELVLMMKREIYLPSDIIAEAWTEGYGLVLVDTGVLAVYSVQKIEMGHLIDGDYFDEASLVTDQEVRMSYVVAVTSCSVLILPKEKFRRMMQQYPKLFFEMKDVIGDKYSRKFSSIDPATSRLHISPA